MHSKYLPGKINILSGSTCQYLTCYMLYCYRVSIQACSTVSIMSKLHATCKTWHVYTYDTFRTDLSHIRYIRIAHSALLPVFLLLDAQLSWSNKIVRVLAWQPAWMTDSNCTKTTWTTCSQSRLYCVPGYYELSPIFNFDFLFPVSLTDHFQRWSSIFKSWTNNLIKLYLVTNFFSKKYLVS